MNFVKFLQNTFFYRTLPVAASADGCLLNFAFESNIANCACTTPAAPVLITTKCAYSSGVAPQTYYLITALCQITLAVSLLYDIIV